MQSGAFFEILEEDLNDTLSSNLIESFVLIHKK